MELLSILGLYNYDNTIFDDMPIPENVSRETLVGNILAECAELEFLYADADFAKDAINLWAAARLPSWSRMATALDAEYTPLVDYKVTETGQAGGSSTNKAQSFDGTDMTDRDTTTSNSTHSVTREGYGKYAPQALVRKEYDLGRLNIYHAITDDFKQRFCLLVY